MRFRVLWVLGVLVVGPGCLAGAGGPYRQARQQFQRAAVDPAPPDAPPFADHETLELSSLVAEVVARNPDMEAARQAWRVALEQVPQAAALPDPMLMLGTAPISLADPDVPNGMQVQVSQGIPFPGKLHARAERAMAEAEARALDYEQARIDLAHTAALLHADYYLVEEARRINEEHIRLLQDFRRIAAARFSAGEAMMAAPLQADTELGHLRHRRAALNSQREIIRARINALLHRPLDELLPSPPAMGVSDEGPEVTTWERPDLRALDARLRAASAGQKLARLHYLPDFSVSGQYSSMWAMVSHRWMVGVGLNIPLQLRSRRAGSAQADARLRQLEAKRTARTDQVELEIHTARTQLEENAEIAHEFERKILPSARSRVTAARSMFETGRSTFLELIDAQKTLLNDELGYHQAIAAHQRARASLLRALGRIPSEADEPRREEP